MRSKSIEKRGSVFRIFRGEKGERQNPNKTEGDAG
jgi:hypothetical protein